MTLLATIFAVIATAPGLGILLAIVSLPPLVRTMFVVQRRQERGLEVNSEEKVALFIVSSTVTIVVSSVTLFLGLFTFCGAFPFTSTQSGWSVGLLTLFISTALTILAIWFFSNWIRRRYNRDITRP
jgi:sterol desaturase/sphingolipid hydroxylase (fatty acid hydroxylase superfamily)